MTIVKIYTLPNQIPGYAPANQAVAHITMNSLSYEQPASTDSLAAFHLQ